jgi:hypothetical protein
MQRILVIAGVVLIVAGVLWPWLGKLPLGRLPGDIVIEAWIQALFPHHHHDLGERCGLPYPLAAAQVRFPFERALSPFLIPGAVLGVRIKVGVIRIRDSFKAVEP